MKTFKSLILAVTIVCAPATVLAQAMNPEGTAEQREAMQALAWMDGEWTGQATMMTPGGGSMTHPHTERIGPMLGGSIKVIEGHSYNDDGSTGFNAFAVVSWNDATDSYTMRSYANGQAGDFPLEATADGFRWSTEAYGGRGRMNYVTTFIDGEWVETGEYVAEGIPPMKVIELRLRRRGDSTWPAAGSVQP